MTEKLNIGGRLCRENRCQTIGQSPKGYHVSFSMLPNINSKRVEYKSGFQKIRLGQHLESCRIMTTILVQVM